MDQPIGNLSELSLPGSRAMRLPNRYRLGSPFLGTKKETVSWCHQPHTQRVAQTSERFMAVLKLRGTGHQLSILPLAVDRRS
ncbi:hypothetical protein Peur_040045 [Populus x canadensis]